ncbi:hypothetical protein BDK51DRAFT_30474 [Blyttiomyces helicus]|uniref:Uncharacterized protein n=1 Tax=Blyttiomyces helicus TaxID=388810 RepID=A0A4P9WIZ5_9FUNG|nr:hypothetical protein BDK51DRAFT_30474 [Blyttiomyces helicus]|eukprot:RKO92879.1 hypothetical protein BDK51DRAFT_30474 [Blyttiomyces helicus]
MDPLQPYYDDAIKYIRIWKKAFKLSPEYPAIYKAEVTDRVPVLFQLASVAVAGNYIAQDAANTGIPRVIVAPILIMTLMFAPVGFMLYAPLRRIAGAKSAWLSHSLPAAAAVGGKKGKKEY